MKLRQKIRREVDKAKFFYTALYDNMEGDKLERSYKAAKACAQLIYKTNLKPKVKKFHEFFKEKKQNGN